MIPVVALFLLWQRLPLLAGKNIRPAWLAIGFMLLALAGGALGELSALYTVVQYAFLLALYALVLSIFGWRGSWLMWAPLAYLIFMIPLPNFLYIQFIAATAVNFFRVRRMGDSPVRHYGVS